MRGWQKHHPGLGRGQPRISDRIGWLLLVLLAVADTAEVVWVSLQRWRGVASHFNNDSALDSLFLIMGGWPSAPRPR